MTWVMILPKCSLNWFSCSAFEIYRKYFFLTEYERDIFSFAETDYEVKTLWGRSNFLLKRDVNINQFDQILKRNLVSEFSCQTWYECNVFSFYMFSELLNRLVIIFIIVFVDSYSLNEKQVFNVLLHWCSDLLNTFTLLNY